MSVYKLNKPSSIEEILILNFKLEKCAAETHRILSNTYSEGPIKKISILNGKIWKNYEDK